MAQASRGLKLLTRDFPKLWQRLLGFVRRRTPDAEAEDITAEVFSRAVLSLRQKDTPPQYDSLEPWLFKIAQNLMVESARTPRRRRQKTAGDLNIPIEEWANPESSTEADVLYDKQQEQSLFAAISKLTVEEQYLVYYRYFAEYDSAQISALTDIKVATVNVKLMRLRKKLARIIDDNAQTR